MNQEFLSTLQKKETYYEAIFAKLYKGVIETNKLIGIGLEDITEEQREALIETYFKLRVEEGKEVEEAIEKEDKVNLVNELIDVLVVAGYEYYLENKQSFSEYNKNWTPDEDSIEDDLSLVISNSKTHRSPCSTLIATQDVLTKMDCDLGKATDEVLRANLSKFATINELFDSLNPMTAEYLSKSTALEFQIDLLEQGGRYSGVSAEKVIDNEGQERYVFWSSKEYGNTKKKYLKPQSFVSADLSGIWK